MWRGSQAEPVRLSVLRTLASEKVPTICIYICKQTSPNQSSVKVCFKDGSEVRTRTKGPQVNIKRPTTTSSMHASLILSLQTALSIGKQLTSSIIMPTRILVRVPIGVSAAAAAALPDVAMSAAAADVFPTKEEVGEIEDEMLTSKKRATEEWLHKEQPTRPLLHPQDDGVVHELRESVVTAKVAGYHDCFSNKRAAAEHMLLQPPKMQPPTDGVQQQRWESDAKVASAEVDEVGLASQKKRARIEIEQPPLKPTAANKDTDKDIINTNHPLDKYKKMCSAEGCSKGVQAGGVCWKHMDQFKVCRAEECNEPARTRGLCIRHDALRLVCSYRGCANQVCRDGLCMRHGNCTQKTECRVEGCTKQVVKGGVCYKHGPKRPTCNFRGCANQQKRHGFCVKHIKLSSDTAKSEDQMLKA